MRVRENASNLAMILLRCPKMCCRSLPRIRFVSGMLLVFSWSFLFAFSTAEAQTTNPSSNPSFFVGQPVEVYVRDGNWYPARVIQVMPDGRPKVRYDGYDASSDEIVDARGVRTRREASLAPPPIAPPAGQLDPFVPADPGPAVVSPPVPQFEVGDRVEVFARGQWFPARITERSARRAEVLYEGVDYREWVDLVPDWIRPASPSAVAPFPPAIQPIPDSVPSPPPPGDVPIAPSLDEARIAPSPTPSLVPSPTPAAGGLRELPSGLYLMERNLGGVQDRRALYFDPRGRVFENPTGVLDPFDSKAFTSAHPTRSGSVRFSMGELEILWEGGRLPASATYKPDTTGESFEWDFARFTRVGPVTPASLVGAYQAGSSEPIRTENGWRVAGTGLRLTFLADGGYQRENDAGNTMEVGTFTVEGNTLILQARNGSITRHAIFLTPSDGSTRPDLYFDGEFLNAL